MSFRTTRDAWLSVKNETETTINQCKLFSEALHRDLYSPLSRFRETQLKDKRKVSSLINSFTYQKYLADGWKIIKDNEKLKQVYQKVNSFFF